MHCENSKRARKKAAAFLETVTRGFYDLTSVNFSISKTLEDVLSKSQSKLRIIN